jgi:hypothetical protein
VTYPAGAIEAQHAYWDAGAPNSSDLMANALHWRSEAGKGCKSHMRERAESTFVSEAWRTWKEARRAAGKST